MDAAPRDHERRALVDGDPPALDTLGGVIEYLVKNSVKIDRKLKRVRTSGQADVESCALNLEHPPAMCTRYGVCSERSSGDGAEELASILLIRRPFEILFEVQMDVDMNQVFEEKRFGARGTNL